MNIFEKIPMPPSARLLGWELQGLDAERGWIKVGFTALPEFINPAGTVQGGILTAMLDDTMGPAVVAHSNGQYFPSTIDLHVHFLKPVRLGPISVEAQITQMGKTIPYLEGKLFNSEGELAARGVSSVRITEPQHKQKTV
jgi:uncharacterized protein (TIGR00369 family)